MDLVVPAEATGPEPVASAPRFVAGDPLRAIAALCVVVYHAAYLSVNHGRSVGSPPQAEWDSVFGAIPRRVVENLDFGIYIFFVLSGYLLSRPFVNAFIGSQAKPELGRYLRNRALRILPAFWVVALATLLLRGGRGTPPPEVGSVFLFAQSYFPSPFAAQFVQAWTLDVELVFYLGLPLGAGLVAWAFGRRHRAHRPLIVLGAAAAVFVASIAFRFSAPGSLISIWSFPSMVSAFMPGIALAALEPWGKRRLSGHPRGPLFAAGCLVAAALVLIPFVDLERGAVGKRAVLAALASGLIVAGPLAYEWSRGRGWRPLNSTILHWLGRRSYGIYLIHFLVLLELAFVIRAADGPRVAFAFVLPLGLAITIVASAFLYRFIERPFLSRRRSWRLARRMTEAPPSDAVPATGAPLEPGHGTSPGQA